jgi:hypothetical protein
MAEILPFNPNAKNKKAVTDQGGIPGTSFSESQKDQLHDLVRSLKRKGLKVRRCSFCPGYYEGSSSHDGEMLYLQVHAKAGRDFVLALFKEQGDKNTPPLYGLESGGFQVIRGVNFQEMTQRLETILNQILATERRAENNLTGNMPPKLRLV